MSEVKRFGKLLKPEQTALLIIDIQERILHVINNHQLVVDNTLKLIKGFKVLELTNLFHRAVSKRTWSNNSFYTR